MRKGRQTPLRKGDWGEWKMHDVKDLSDPKVRAQLMIMKTPTDLLSVHYNQRFTVMRYNRIISWYGVPITVIQLSIRLNHNEGPYGTHVTWAEKQRIKNELCGVDQLGIEVFPPEDLLIDEANMYHLWVFEPYFHFPIDLNRVYQGLPTT